jgi:DNA-binding response OmpR family regulator
VATILVADDDHLLRAIMRECLERADHTVLEAGDGIAALDIALDERPDCLLLDVMMPLARGLEVVRQVRLQEDWNPAIIMISARTRFADRMNALDAGANAYVEKPFEPDGLLDMIDKNMREAGPSGAIDRVTAAWAAIADTRPDDEPAVEPARQDAPPADDPDRAERYFRERLDVTLGRQRTETEERTERYFRESLNVALRRGHSTDDVVVPETPAAAATESLFGQAIRRTLGHSSETPPRLPLTDESLQSIWEASLEAVAGTAIERDIPTVTGPRVPHPLATLFDRAADEVLDAHRALVSPATVVDAYWGERIATALTGREPTPGPPSRIDPVAVERTSRHALRTALAARDGATELSATWDRAIANLHQRDEELTRPHVLDALEAVVLGVGPRAPDVPVEVAS